MRVTRTPDGWINRVRYGAVASPSTVGLVATTPSRTSGSFARRTVSRAIGSAAFMRGRWLRADGRAPARSRNDAREQIPDAGERPSLRLHQLLSRALRRVHGGHDEILEHGDVVRVDDLGIDLHLEELALAVRGDHHHAAARSAGHFLLRQLLLGALHLLLELLVLLEQRVEIDAGHRLLLAEVPHIFDLPAQNFHRGSNGRVLAPLLEPPALLLLTSALFLVMEADLRCLGRLLDAQRNLASERCSESRLDRRARVAILERQRVVGVSETNFDGAVLDAQRDAAFEGRRRGHLARGPYRIDQPAPALLDRSLLG